MECRIDGATVLPHCQKSGQSPGRAPSPPNKLRRDMRPGTRASYSAAYPSYNRTGPARTSPKVSIFGSLHWVPKSQCCAFVSASCPVPAIALNLCANQAQHRLHGDKTGEDRHNRHAADAVRQPFYNGSFFIHQRLVKHKGGDDHAVKRPNVRAFHDIHAHAKSGQRQPQSSG